MADKAEALKQACELVGRFFYHFGRVELQLDDAITKLFKLNPDQAPIITANIAFIGKAYIIETVARLQAKAGKPVSVDLEKIFRSIKGINDPPRQTVASGAHSVNHVGQLVRLVGKSFFPAAVSNLAASFQPRAPKARPPPSRCASPSGPPRTGVTRLGAPLLSELSPQRSPPTDKRISALDRA